MTRPILSPAAIEPMCALRHRRAFMVFACLLTYVWLVRELVVILASGGWSAMDCAILACFLVAAPWTVLGFWNALVGLWLIARQNKVTAALDRVQSGEFGSPARTAVVMTVRNEDIERAIARLAIVKQSLDKRAQSLRFHYFLLSDTSQAALMEEEESAFARWQKREAADASRMHYRRRPHNSGHKAGNLRDFCQKWRSEFELMVVLDADSLMTGDKILGMVRTAVAYPRVGIVQSLVVGMPTMSAFGRLFQFGMRHGMRPYSLATAWWAGDCSQFWGHNAVVRISPFVDHCQLPVIPGRPPFGGEILSHDQVEAALMRKESRGGHFRSDFPKTRRKWEDRHITW